MAIPAINKINFQAQWTPPINNLKPVAGSLAFRVYDFIKSILFFIPNSLLEPVIRWPILPSSSPLLKKNLKPYDKDFEEFWINKTTDPMNIWNQSMDGAADSCRVTYATTELSMTTPDNITLKGQFLKHKHHDTNPNSRVIILFHGNGDKYQLGSPAWMIRLLKDSDTPYSFLLFNPRGVGESIQGVANSKNLLLDSETAYQLVKDQLHVPESRIDMYGQSLGGAQAANLKKLHSHTGGKVLLDRTFSNLDVEVSYFLGRLPNFIKRFAIYLIKKFDWEFDNYNALKKIKDPVHIFYHKKDDIIPEHCSLGRAVLDKNPSPANISVYEYNNQHFGQSGQHHNEPLTEANLIDPRTGTSKPSYGSKDLLKDIFQHNVARPARSRAVT